MSFNKIILVGNLGRDPELRYTPQGGAVCSFSMATNERKKDKSGEFQDVTTWFKVTLWGKLAENASKYLTKGKQVYIEGRLRIEEWEDRENINRYTLDVQATEMQFLAGGSGEDHSALTQDRGSEMTGPTLASTSAPVSAPANPDDDIPF